MYVIRYKNDYIMWENKSSAHTRPKWRIVRSRSSLDIISTKLKYPGANVSSVTRSK